MCVFSGIELGFCYSRSVLKMDLYNDLVEGLSLSCLVYIRVISSLFSNELYGLDCVKYLPVV